MHVNASAAKRSLTFNVATIGGKRQDGGQNEVRAIGVEEYGAEDICPRGALRYILLLCTFVSIIFHF